MYLNFPWYINISNNWLQNFYFAQITSKLQKKFTFFVLLFQKPSTSLSSETSRKIRKSESTLVKVWNRQIASIGWKKWRVNYPIHQILSGTLIDHKFYPCCQTRCKITESLWFLPYTNTNFYNFQTDKHFHRYGAFQFDDGFYTDFATCMEN